MIREDEDYDIWHVVDLLIIDTNCDDNINIKFYHESIPMAAFVPTGWIQNFQLNTTKKVRRTLDHTTENEIWESIS